MSSVFDESAAAAHRIDRPQGAPSVRRTGQSLQVLLHGVIIDSVDPRCALRGSACCSPDVNWCTACPLHGRRVIKFMATPRRIKVTDSGKVTVVTFNDSKIIDEVEIQEFGQELYDLVEREGRKKIILNFGNVEFLSSAALGKLIGFDKRVKQHGAELILSNIRPEIYEVFAITKLTKLFVIKDDEADALAAI
jgi:anti-anti-sigma factor